MELFGVSNRSFSIHLVMLALLLASGCVGESESRQIMGKLVDDFHDHHHHNQDRVRDQNTHMHMHVSGSSESSNYSPFFTTTDLKLGFKTFQNFPPNLDAKASYFLPKNVADSIPFSLSQLSEILTIFSLPPGSGRAKDVEDSLRACESPPINGETKFCATSLESLVDLIRYSFGISEEIRGHQGLSILTSTFLDHPKIAFQGFTVLKSPEEVEATMMMGCHLMSYPFTAFYCHRQGGRDRVYRVLLGGDNGDKITAIVACHDTIAKWDPDIGEFHKVRVSERPVCHFFPPHGNLVWVYNGTLNKSA